MNELAAALGIEQLKRMEGFLQIRKRNYNRLAEALRGVQGITTLQSKGNELRMNSNITNYEYADGEYQSSYYCLSVLLDEPLTPKRFEIVQYLKEHGVGTSVYYPKPVPLMQYYKEKYGYRTEDFPIAHAISERSISLPVGPHLNEGDIEYIATTVKEAIAITS